MFSPCQGGVRGGTGETNKLQIIFGYSSMHSRKHCVIKKYCITLLVALGISAVHAPAAAVTRFSAGAPEKKAPAPCNFDDIWFYDGSTKIMPEISMTWLTVVFDSRYAGAANGLEGTYDTFIPEKSKALIKSRSSLIDYFYDAHIAEDACFFRLREGLKRDELKEIINQLNQDEAVLYTHPAIILKDKTWAFFNIFDLEWKAGAGRERRAALLKQAQAGYDEKENICRVNVLEIPFFKALNLLAEDISVLRARPYLVELNPSIRVQLALAMSGGRIGDTVPFTFTILFSDRVSIDPSSIANINLRPASIQKELFDCSFDLYDYTKVISKSPVIITGRIKFFAPGEFVIPAVTVSYTCPACSGETVRSVETRPIPFRVASMVPAVKEEFRLLVPSKPVQPDYQASALHYQAQSSLWQAAGGLLVCILCLGWVAVLFFRQRQEQRLLTLRTREDLLAERLRVLVQAAPAHAHWHYLTEAGTLLREYVVARYGNSRTLPGGSAHYFVDSVRNDIPGQYLDPLETVLAAIDNAVALEQESCPEIDQIRMEILRLLDLTGSQPAA